MPFRQAKRPSVVKPKASVCRLNSNPHYLWGILYCHNRNLCWLQNHRQHLCSDSRGNWMLRWGRRKK